MEPGGRDIIITHNLKPADLQREVADLFRYFWPRLVIENDGEETFIHKDADVKKSIDRYGVRPSDEFVHVISKEGELTVVVPEKDEFIFACVDMLRDSIRSRSENKE